MRIPFPSNCFMNPNAWLLAYHKWSHKRWRTCEDGRDYLLSLVRETNKTVILFYLLQKITQKSIRKWLSVYDQVLLNCIEYTFYTLGKSKFAEEKRVSFKRPFSKPSMPYLKKRLNGKCILDVSFYMSSPLPLTCP